MEEDRNCKCTHYRDKLNDSIRFKGCLVYTKILPYLWLSPFEGQKNGSAALALFKTYIPARTCKYVQKQRNQTAFIFEVYKN